MISRVVHRGTPQMVRPTGNGDFTDKPMKYLGTHSNLERKYQKACNFRRSQAGAAYLMLMLAVVVMGIGLVAVSEVWHTTLKRDKELELLFYGDQFRQAIALYYANTPGRAQRYPSKLEDLLKDPRFPGTKRYLRKLFFDPMTGDKNWGLVRDSAGGIIGVHSMSNEETIKKSNFKLADRFFQGKRQYSDWVFVYQGRQGILPTPRSSSP